MCITYSVTAQQINPVPGSLARTLDNGWYKFEAEGAVLDVEVQSGYIIKGNIKWFNDDSYSGDLAGSQLSGKGTYKWQNGERYEGIFKKNQRHGKGTMFYSNGEKYSGKWKNDQPHGKGKIWKADGSVEQGVWENGTLKEKK